MDSAQVWLLFIKYLHEFLILTKRRQYCLHFFSNKPGSRLRDLLGFHDTAICSRIQAQITYLPSLVCALLHRLYLTTTSSQEGDERNRLWLIYWRLWLPREAEQDFQLPSVSQKVELCASTLSPEGNMKEPGCLAQGRRGPSALAVNYPGEGCAGKCCIMPSPPLNRSDLFAVVCRCCFDHLVKEKLAHFSNNRARKELGFYMIADCFFPPHLKKAMQVLLS